jgi:V/A-type H+-transporting ATPase subunit C
MSSIIRRPSLGPHVRGLKAKALPRDKAIALAYANTPEEYLNILRTTRYSITLDKLTRETLPDLRKQIIEVYMNDVREIYLGSPSDGREVIKQHLKRFEYDNIEYIVTAIRAGKNPEDYILLEPLEFTGRRYVVTSLLGAKSVDEVGERLRALRHPAADAFALMQKYGYDKSTIFIDRQWIIDYLDFLRKIKDKSLERLIETLAAYFDISLAVRAHLWGLSPEEVSELSLGAPTSSVKAVLDAVVRGEIARALEAISALSPWGSVISSLVSEEPTFERLSIALDNAYPAIMWRMASTCIIECSEFALGSLLAALEALRAEAMLVIRAAAMVVEGVSAEKRRDYFTPLTLI